MHAHGDDRDDVNVGGDSHVSLFPPATNSTNPNFPWVYLESRISVDLCFAKLSF